jgi:hypothetical protein
LETEAIISHPVYNMSYHGQHSRKIALLSADESFSSTAGGYIYYATPSYLELFAAG